MSKMKLLALLACAAAALPLGARAEGEDAVSASLDVPVLSAYVWRGQVLVDDPVVQPTFTVSKGGFALNWWGNFNLDDKATGDELEFSEHDITVSYSGLTCPLTGAGITLGVVNYDFPNPAVSDGDPVLVNDTRELFLTYSLAEVLLAPTLNVYYDFKEYDGFYASLGISHSIELAEKVTLALGASIGAADSDWAGGYYTYTDDADPTVPGSVETKTSAGSGISDYIVSASLPLAVTENLTITPGLSYSALMGDPKDIVESGKTSYLDKDKLVGSLKLSYAF